MKEQLPSEKIVLPAPGSRPPGQEFLCHSGDLGKGFSPADDTTGRT